MRYHSMCHRSSHPQILMKYECRKEKMTRANVVDATTQEAKEKRSVLK